MQLLANLGSFLRRYADRRHCPRISPVRARCQEGPAVEEGLIVVNEESLVRRRDLHPLISRNR